MAASTPAKDGLTALNEGRYDDAIVLLEQAWHELGTAEGAAALQVQFALAEAYRRTGKLKPALALYQHLLESDDVRFRTQARAILERLEKVKKKQWERRNRPSAAPMPGEPANSANVPPVPEQTAVPQPVEPATQPAVPPLAAPTPVRPFDPWHASLTEFQQYFQQHLHPQLLTYERRRRSSLLLLALATAIAGVAGAVAIGGAVVAIFQLPAMLAKIPVLDTLGIFALLVVIIGAIALGAFGFALVCWTAVYSSVFDTFSRGYRLDALEAVVDSLCSARCHLDVRESLMEERRLDSNALAGSGLFPSTLLPDYVLSANRIGGRFDDVSIQLADVWALRAACAPAADIRTWQPLVLPPPARASVPPRIQLPARGLRALYYRAWRIRHGMGISDDIPLDLILEAIGQQSVFQGLFCIAEFGEISRGRFTLVPAKAADLPRLSDRLERMPLEDDAFGRLFAVFDDRRNTAARVLTPPLRELLANFCTQSDRRVALSTYDGRLYLAIPTPRQLLEPNLFTSAAQFEPLQEYFACVRFALAAIELISRDWEI
ncbi:putative drug exporters of the RND superfamily [Rubidibacter lacunae KORDI 51-2]|uniref:Putative drug exporters of the RND superfamily n=1 Tax=Rubidibacter lacunae KORDI 51-2 TaxID=582515 RepID=U5DF33_9CHRO|nr:DUF3137 domain-containing protein [Rubidibacter lacunae]ERN39922.1 putative drug exporters of the RND superfamily [Rubidibacter lacunae KORDI 51-2]